MMHFLTLILFSLSATAQLSNQYPTSPAATTVNAVPLWGDSTGGSILNSPVLFDTSAWTAGQTATFTLPSAGAFNRIWAFPNVDGTFFISGGGQTLATSFMSESLTWFNNSDSSKRMTFDLSDITTATTVAVKAPRESGRMVVNVAPCTFGCGKFEISSSVGIGFIGKIVADATGSSATWTLPTNGGNLVTGAGPFVNTNISNADFADDYIMDDYTAIFGGTPAAPPAFDVKLYNSNDDFWMKRSDGTTRNLSSASSVSVPFTDGDVARRITVTDSLVTATTLPILTIKQPTSASLDAQTGYQYVANVVSVSAGSFDVFITCTLMGMEDASEEPPNETITLYYQLR